MGRLNEEFRGLRDDLQRKLALVAQKEGVIAEMRNEACTLWASGLLFFWRKASKAFPVSELRVSFGLSCTVPSKSELRVSFGLSCMIPSKSELRDSFGLSCMVPSKYDFVSPLD